MRCNKGTQHLLAQLQFTRTDSLKKREWQLLAKNFVLGLLIFSLSNSVNANEVLHGARGRIFNANVSRRCFELLKSTSYDPVTNEGQSRFTVYWNARTRFQRVEEQSSFNGIHGPVVTEFYYLDPVATQAVRNGENFSCRFADVYPEDKNNPNGLRLNGRRFAAWFTPDPNSKQMLSGTVDINGASTVASLAERNPAVLLRYPTTEEFLNAGLFATRIYGKELDGKFIMSKVELYPLDDPRETDDPNLPRVLVIGDSISMNYHNAATTALKGKANYHRIEGNGGPSDRGVLNMDLWLGDYTQPGFQWDVILFNHGLHDLKQAFNSKSSTWGSYQVPIEAYKANLESEIEILKATGAQLIWCSTTPVPKSSRGRFGRQKGEDLVFNRAALEVFRNHPEIQFLDLNSLVRQSSIFDEWRAGDNVHFRANSEQQILGKAVAGKIMKVLGP